jgi:hypothetical protein
MTRVPRMVFPTAFFRRALLWATLLTYPAPPGGKLTSAVSLLRIGCQ